MWENCVVTKNGAELLGRLSGIELTGAKFGISTVPDAALAMQTDVSAPKGNLGITDFKRLNGGFALVVQAVNTGVREEYTIRQVGIYAKEKGSDSEKEILLAVTQDTVGERIPLETDMPDFCLQFTMIVEVSNEAEITANIDSSLAISREQAERIVNIIVEPIEEKIDEHLIDTNKHITAEDRIKWNGKADKDALDSHIKNKSNPHEVTKEQVGLGNVPNVATNDQTPAYNAAASLAELTSGEKLGTAFGKLAKAVKDLIGHLADSVRHVTAAERTAWNGKAAGNHTHEAATSSANGFMSKDDKSKLDGIAAGANKYTHPSTSGNKHIPSGGKSGQILRWSADGTAAWGADNNTTYGAATQSADGLMSAADKTKLDGIAASANNYTHPAYTARTGVPTANQTPAFGSTFSVSQPVSDASGHITALTSRTVKIPNTAATASKAGLMSAADKTKLDGIEAEANKSIVTCGTIETIISGSGSSTHLSDNSVTIPHKTDLIIVNYTGTVNSYATLVSETLNSIKTACGLGTNITFTASFGTSSATLTIKGSGGVGRATYTAIKLT